MCIEGRPCPGEYYSWTPYKIVLRSLGDFGTEAGMRLGRLEDEEEEHVDALLLLLLLLLALSIFPFVPSSSSSLPFIDRFFGYYCLVVKYSKVDLDSSVLSCKKMSRSDVTTMTE